MLDQIYISRQFTVDGEMVDCHFFKPESYGQDYRCRYEIMWLDRPRSRWVCGVDEVQALLLAMQAAHTDLLIARKDDGLQISWLDQDSLGLPLAQTLRDMDPDGYF